MHTNLALADGSLWFPRILTAFSRGLSGFVADLLHYARIYCSSTPVGFVRPRPGPHHGTVTGENRPNPLSQLAGLE